MSSESVAASAMTKTRSWRERFKSIERDLRLGSGLVLMVFAATHFLNHALGIFGLDVMTAAQEWRVFVWRSWIGTILLYGAAVVHILLALKRVMRRRTLRMPLADAVQMVLGLLIPFLLAGHLIGTRLLHSYGGLDTSYVYVLRVIWPDNAIHQSLLLLVVWGHGVMGLYYAFHNRRWFAAWVPVLAAVAAVIPAVALAGFLAASREAASAAIPPLHRTPEQFALQAKFGMIANWSMALVLGAAALVLVVRFVRARLGKRITIRYFGNGQVETVVGASLLEISRAGNIPHPSACGGRGRCSSCRVLILEGEQSLAPPAGVEKRVLERIRAPRHIRLACQVHPTADLNVRVLLSSQSLSAVPEQVNEALDWGVSEELTVLSADIRGFATLAEHQLPSDVIALLNRLIGEMAHAVEGRGGRVAAVQTDGIVALFGMGGKARAGGRAAIHAAADMLKAMNLVNKDVSNSLPLPVRVGIGVHSGPVLLSRADESFSGQRLVVVGEAVIVASRLEEATKELAADCVISSRTIALAGLSPPATPERAVHYKNGRSPVMAHSFADRHELRKLIRQTAAGGDTPEAAAPQPVA